MSDTCPTVKIASAAAPGGFVIINEEDFDKATQALWSDGKRGPVAAQAVAAKAVDPEPQPEA